MQDGVKVGNFIICLLAFFNTFIYFLLLFIFFLIKKKRGPEGGPKGDPEGRVHVLM